MEMLRLGVQGQDPQKKSDGNTDNAGMARLRLPRLRLRGRRWENDNIDGDRLRPFTQPADRKGRPHGCRPSPAIEIREPSALHDLSSLVSTEPVIYANDPLPLIPTDGNTLRPENLDARARATKTVPYLPHSSQKSTRTIPSPNAEPPTMSPSTGEPRVWTADARAGASTVRQRDESEARLNTAYNTVGAPRWREYRC